MATIRIGGTDFNEVDRPQPTTTTVGFLASLLDYGYNADVTCYRNWEAMNTAASFMQRLDAAGYVVVKKPIA